jgi:hypothetical protein
MTAAIKVGDLVKVRCLVFRPDPIPIGTLALVIEKVPPDKVLYRNDLVLLYRGQRLHMSSELCTKVLFWALQPFM